MNRQDHLDNIGIWLSRLGRLMNSRRVARGRLRRAGEDLPPLAYSTMAVISRSRGARLTDVAEELDLDPSRISKEIQRLLRVGYLEQRADPADRRARYLQLTEAGDKSLDRYRTAAFQILAETLSTWSDDDVGELDRILDRLIASFTGGD